MAIGSDIGMMAAFAAGMISFLTPCVLPLVPGYVSYISGTAVMDTGQTLSGRIRTLPSSFCFVLGFSTVFVALGASATLISRILLSYRYEMNLLGGAVVILFGAFAAGLVSIPWLQRNLHFQGDLPRGKMLGAYALGLAFGFGWTPCIGPALGAILTISAASATANAGIVLLSAYSLGLGIPFVLSALFTESLMRHMGSLRGSGRILKVGAGTVMIAMGVAMMTGSMSTFSYWLLDTFPVLSTIG